MGHLWLHLLHSFAEARMPHRKYIHSLISGADGHLCGRGHAPQWDTSQNVAIQERFLSSVDFPLQQNARLNHNAEIYPIYTNVAPNKFSTQLLQCTGRFGNHIYGTVRYLAVKT